MNLRTLALLGGLAAVIAAGTGVLKIKHGLAIGAALVVTGFLMPDAAETATMTTT
jgi:ABC-type transport system involved in cytochrome bd biosynthesis fused ATPase/permease subunit